MSDVLNTATTVVKLVVAGVGGVGPAEGAARCLVADRHRQGIRADVAAGATDMGLQARRCDTCRDQSKDKII